MKRCFYGWVVAATAFVMIFVSMGLCNSTHGLYQIPVTTALDMSRAQFSSIATFRYVTAMSLNFSFGMLAGRFGLRRLGTFGVAAFSGAMLLFSLGTSPVWFYLGGIFMGFGSALGGNTLASALISNWFVKHRGAVLGVVLCASGVGGAVFSQMVNYWITEFGWRHSYRTSFVIALVCALVVVALVRTKPEEMGLRPLQSDTGGDFVSKKTGEKKALPCGKPCGPHCFTSSCPAPSLSGF